MHLISVLLGLVIAWVILFFIGPKKRVVSYYVQAPVVGMPISEIDSAMEAVGLASSDWKGQAEGPNTFDPQRPEALPSVAQVALNESTPSLGDQDTYSTPQAFSPEPSPSPSIQ